MQTSRAILSRSPAAGSPRRTCPGTSGHWHTGDLSAPRARAAAFPGHGDGQSRARSAPRGPGQTQRRAAKRGAWAQGLFPVLDLEFRLLAALPVIDLQLQVFRANAFLELERRTALVVAVIRTLATEESDQLVLAHLEVAQIQAVHAAL